MKIYVTGLGVVSSIGIGVEKNITSLKAGRHGMGKITLFPTELDVPVSEVKRTSKRLKQLLRLKPGTTFSRTTLLGMLAAKEAFKDADFHPMFNRVALISATSVGGMDLSEHFYTSFKENPQKGKLRDIVSHDCAASTELIASYIRLEGYTTTISTACSSAANAIMQGARLIHDGQVDAVVVGGTDALCRFTLNGFNSLMILDKEHCRPFDESRAGLNLGEGAGYLVLQSERTCLKTPYCELTGYANSNDAYHQTGSSPEGDGAYRSMSQAIAMSGIAPEEIGYINVHGTGTPGNDASESHALKRIFGKHVPPFSSVKPFIGHTLGASEGIEAVFSVLALYNGYTYPNLNFKQVDPAIGILPETSFQEGRAIKHVLCNAFGFGGNSASLVFSAADHYKLPGLESITIPRFQRPAFGSHVYINNATSIHADGATNKEQPYLSAHEPDYKTIITNANLRRRMSRIVKMGVACGLECIGATAPEKIQAIITATGLGCLADTEKFMNAIIDQKEQLLNPTPFIQSTFNTIGAQLALLSQIHADNTTHSHRALSFENALVDGMTKIAEGYDNTLVGAIDELTPTSYIIQQRLGLLKGVQAGEGTQFFLLSSQPNDGTWAEICDIETDIRPAIIFEKGIKPDHYSSARSICLRFGMFLGRNKLKVKDIDWFVTGENGNPGQDCLYADAKELFAHATQSTFKDECGEYPTATSYAVWKVINALKDPEHPAKTVLICNHYHSNEHSIILIKKHSQ